jgi:hypothetical protein
MTIEISTQWIAIYSLIGIAALIAAYVYGKARTEREYKQVVDEAYDLAHRSQVSRDMWEDKHSKLVKTYNTLANNYATLEKEIEAHVHEVHEEVERPHVQYDEKSGRDIWEESDDDKFWESINRMKNNDQ